MDTPSNDKRPVVVAAGRNMRNRTVTLLCEKLADFKRQNDGGSPTYKELSHLMGYKGKGSNLCYVVEEAVRRGWLKPRPPRSQSNLYFTEKGRARFMPETIEKGQNEKAPEPAPAPPPAPEQDTAAAEDECQVWSPEGSVLGHSVEGPDYRVDYGTTEFRIGRKPAVREYEQGRLVEEMSLDVVRRAVAVAPTDKLIMELIDRGYTVRKG